MVELSRRAQNKLEKEKRILHAAIGVFAQHGYSAATMDQVAAQAGLTKPTVYQYFSSKEDLFKAMMQTPRQEMMMAFEEADSDTYVGQLLDFAWRYAQTVMRPDFLSLARLIIGEAHRFPQIGQAYQASGPDRVLDGLKMFMERQRDLGTLTFDDAELAAQDFWGLILSAPRNKALHEPDNIPPPSEVARYINNGLRVFLRAYSTNPKLDLLRFEERLESCAHPDIANRT